MGLDGTGIIPVCDVNNNSNRGNGFDGDGAFSWIFFLFFLLAWGNGYGGFGGFGNNGGGVAGMTYLNGISNDFIYTNLNNTLGQGFTQLTNQNFGISKDIQAGVSQLSNGICSSTYKLTSDINNVGNKIQNCCCETNRNIDSVRYENAKNTCDIINNANMNTRDLLESNNAQTQRIIDYLTNQEIQSLRSELQSAQMALQNNAQTANIINQLKPVPIPAYLTCSPYASYNLPNNQYCNTNQCCGNGLI